MHEGIYESLVTRALSRDLAQLVDLEPTRSPVDEADQPHVLARHVAQATERVLSATKDVETRVRLVNDLMAQLASAEESLDGKVEHLTHLARAAMPGIRRHVDCAAGHTPLRRGSAHQCSRRAVARCRAAGRDRHLRRGRPAVRLREVARPAPPRGATAPRKAPRRPVPRHHHDLHGRHRASSARPAGPRVRRRGEDPVRRPAHPAARQGVAVPPRHRLRHRLRRLLQPVAGRAARRRGVERPPVPGRRHPTLLEKFRRHVRHLLERRRRSRPTTRTATATGSTMRSPRRRARRQHDRVTISLSGLEVRPYPYQQEMLEALDVERTVHDRHRNLVVAATGTGKTVIAALDYRGLCDARPATGPSLLFVAHRQEILEQSLRTYREVLADANFGELYVGGARPERWRHVFASVQSLTAYGVAEHPGRRLRRRRHRRVPPRRGRDLPAHPRPPAAAGAARPDRHARARRRRRRPQLLRRPHRRRAATVGRARRGPALPVPLLRRRRRHRPARRSSGARAATTRRAVERLHRQRRARRDRAQAAARQGRSTRAPCGRWASASASRTPSSWPGSSTRPASRRWPSAARRRRPSATQALDDLRDRRVNVLFAADLFNEGLDLPDVDTVLFLRPTESATVFLQQLGRGLRRTRDKAVLTVLDFVGHHRKEFRFDTELPGADRRDPPRPRARDRAGLPVPALRLPDRAGPAGAGSRAGEHPRADREPLAADGRRAALVRRPRPGHLPRRVRASSSPTSCGAEPLVDPAAPRRRPAHPRGGRRCETELLKRDPGLRPRRRPRDARGLPRAARRRCAGLRRPRRQPSSGFARMLFFSLWPDGGGYASYDDGLAALRGERGGSRRTRRSSTCPSTAPATTPSSSPVALRTSRCGCTPGISARRSSPRSTTPTCNASPTRFREGVLYVPELQRRRLLRDAEEVRGRLLPHHDVPRLPDQPDAVPLGVPVDDVGRLPDRPALPHRVEQRAALRPREEDRRVRHRAVPVPRARRPTSRTPASGRSPSPGSSNTPCRRTSSPPQQSPLADTREA